MDRLHQLGADRELVLVELGRLPDHLAKIVAGAEGRAIAAHDHDRNRASAPIALRQAISSCICSTERALRFSGRFIVT